MSYARLILAVVLTLGWSVCFTPQARAGSSFLCEGTLQRVRAGDHLARVLELCGEPDFQDQRLVRRKYKHVIRAACKGVAEVSEERVVEVLVDDWVYDFGYNHHTRYLHFENNVLAWIGSRWVGSW